MEEQETTGIYEQNPSWFRRHWLLTTIFAILIIAVISGILTFQYSSVWGSHKAIIGGQDQTNQFICPQLSSIAFYDYTTEMDSNGNLINSSTWVVKTIDYSTKDSKLVYVGAQQGYNDNNDISVLFCEPGSTFIQNGEDASKYNPNYIYCGNFIMPIVLYKLDSSGNILNSTKTSVQVIFDSKTKSYVTTRCGSYDTINAP